MIGIGSEPWPRRADALPATVGWAAPAPDRPARRWCYRGQHLIQGNAAPQSVQILRLRASRLQPTIDGEGCGNVQIGGTDGADQLQTATAMTRCVIGQTVANDRDQPPAIAQDYRTKEIGWGPMFGIGRPCKRRASASTSSHHGAELQRRKQTIAEAARRQSFEMLAVGEAVQGSGRAHHFTTGTRSGTRGMDVCCPPASDEYPLNTRLSSGHRPWRGAGDARQPLKLVHAPAPANPGEGPRALLALLVQLQTRPHHIARMEDEAIIAGRAEGRRSSCDAGGPAHPGRTAPASFSSLCPPFIVDDEVAARLHFQIARDRQRQRAGLMSKLSRPRNVTSSVTGSSSVASGSNSRRRAVARMRQSASSAGFWASHCCTLRRFCGFFGSLAPASLI